MNDYSISLFLLAKEENCLDELHEDVVNVLKVLKDAQIRLFFENKFIGLKDKQRALQKYFSNINKYLFNFVSIVLKDDKEEDLVEILEGFNILYDDEMNISRGIVYGLEMDDEKLKILQETISRKMNKKVVLEFKQDISLLGGYKIYVDNKLIDCSYKKKLEKLKDMLLKEGD